LGKSSVSIQNGKFYIILPINIEQWFEMKKTFSVVTLMAIMVLCIAVSPIKAATAQDTGNQVSFWLNHEYFYGTSGDSVENANLAGYSSWGFQMYNDIDSSGEAVINPNMTMVSSLTFESFNGLAWNVWFDSFTPNATGPPVYQWYWNRDLGEGEGIYIWADEPYGIESFRPGFSLSRSVTPSTIISPKMLQVVKVNFRLEESLPENTSGVNICEGAWTTSEAEPNLIMESPKPTLVDKEPGYAYIVWYLSAGELVLGKTYTFNAIFLTTKLVKGPIEYKPYVDAGYGSSPGYRLYGTGKSVTVTNQGVTGTFSANNELEWYTSSPWIDRWIDLYLVSGTKAIKTENPLMWIKH
jgi:hypothetical protein